jgi:hypothetical protein
MAKPCPPREATLRTTALFNRGIKGAVGLLWVKVDQKEVKDP